MLTLIFTGSWILLARLAQREYAATVRGRIERRRLDLEGARVTVGDPATIRVLEQTVEGVNARQSCYALSMLAEVPGYDLAPVLRRLSTNTSEEVRRRAYEVAATAGSMELLGAALAEISGTLPGDARLPGGDASAVKSAVAYVLATSSEAPRCAAEFLEHGNLTVVEGALAALGDKPDLARQALSRDWIAASAADEKAERRLLAASAVAVRGAEASGELARLLNDRDPRVVAAACRAAGKLGDHASLDTMIRKLNHPVLRSAVIESLAAFGPGICGVLSDWLADPSAPPGVRRQIPRVLKLIPDQRSADVLLRSLERPELLTRAAVLRALSYLRETAPRLNYGETFVTGQILQEARHCFELYSALAPFRGHQHRGTAAGLLERSLEERLQQTIERMFRLLGLRYPLEDMHAAYLAVHRRRRDQFLAALDFLDTVLDRSLKRVILPLLDSPETLAQRGRDLFGVEIRDAESAIRDLIRSPDPWLAACAMAAAAERHYYRLKEDILAVAAEKQSGAEVAEVARSAAQALSAQTS